MTMIMMTMMIIYYFRFRQLFHSYSRLGVQWITEPLETAALGG